MTDRYALLRSYAPRLAARGLAPGARDVVVAASGIVGLTASLAKELLRHARAEVPNEACGLLAGDLRPLAARDVGGIIQSGGTVLGSARCPEFAEPAGRAKALSNLAGHGIEALVVIGGVPGPIGMLVGAIVVIFLSPVVAGATFVVGLTDTWLDLRSRRTALPPGS